MKHMLYLLAFLILSCDATNEEIDVNDFRCQIYHILSKQAPTEGTLDKEASKTFYQYIHQKTPGQNIETRWEFLRQYAITHGMTGILAEVIRTTNQHAHNAHFNDFLNVLKEEIIAAAMPEGWCAIDITGMSFNGIYYKSASGSDCYIPTSGAALSTLLLLYADFTL